ncbi:alpha/beta fold hydrolase [Ferrimonas balearica]|uniref:alpha/beta fold hydrolase n=1 Tax=Ferrimonas balearica TaxID=44012 RepID=UPI001C992100|nr:alpha/beta hydrolase [Ferrimonas balearica]MBY5991325.1 alpha/beta hydrolase [Ferrimonas balearica]
MRPILLLVMLVLALALALPGLVSTESRPLDDAARAEAPGQFVALSDGQVHYRWWGPEAGEPVVMVHGFSVPSFTWKRNAAELGSAGYRVLTFDLYGRGFSDRPALAYDRATYVGQLSELLDALAVDRPVHLVGLSMGGAVVAAFAADHPKRVASATFLAPFNRPVDVGPLAWPLVGDYLARVFYLPQMPQRQLGDFIAPDEQGPWITRYREQMALEGFADAVITTAQGYLQSDPIGDFQAVGQQGLPSLLIWGDRDSVFPLTQAESVRQALGPSHRFVLVENAGHALHYERDESINQVLLRFYAELAAPTTQRMP